VLHPMFVRPSAHSSITVVDDCEMATPPGMMFTLQNEERLFIQLGLGILSLLLDAGLT
jgi:hypothetical protein